MKRFKGFTLIELLVVIGIIAILFSILLPVLNKVRLRATTLTCLSQLRQVGAAFSFYYQNNKGFYPAHYDSSTPGGDITWATALVASGVARSNKELSCPLEGPWEYYGPSANADFTRNQLGPGGTIPGGYWLNSYAAPFGWSSFGNAELLLGFNTRLPYRPVRIRRSAERALLVDSRSTFDNMSYQFLTFSNWKSISASYVDHSPRNFAAGVFIHGSASWQTISTRHGYKTNVLFYDGHAETMRGEDVWNKAPSDFTSVFTAK